MSVRTFSSEELIRLDLAAAEVALFEINLNLQHYTEERARVQVKIDGLRAELRRLKKGPKSEIA